MTDHLGHTTSPLLLSLDADAHDGYYLALGASVKLKDDEKTALGEPVLVVDRNGLCSLHEVVGIYRPSGIRRVKISPQIEWPQGGKELRDVERYR